MQAYGCAWGDYDNDGDLDAWIGNNTLTGGRLVQNNGNGTFTRITTGPIATTSFVSQAGASWADYDNDGDLDLFVTTFTKNILFNNFGGGNFVKDTLEIFGNETNVESYAAGWADYDNDGDLDIFIPTAFGHPDDRLYDNNLNPSNSSNRNWLKVKCTGNGSNKDAIGTKVIVRATINGVSTRQIRIINDYSTRGGESGATSGRIAFFGLGNASVIDSLIIYWPKTSTSQIYTNITPNQFISDVEAISGLTEVTPCVSELPPSNPGFVTGKIYNDINSNCAYDPGVDFPIANKFVQAEGGTYFTTSNDSGDYYLNLPLGSYNISTNFNGDNWVLSSCQADSVIPVNVTIGDTIYSIDFSEQSLGLPCEDENYDMNITTIPLDAGTCPSGQLLNSPCPGFDIGYCFNIFNNSAISSPSGALLTITFPSDFIVVADLTLPGLISIVSGMGTNTIVVSVNSISSMGNISVCLRVSVDISAALPFTSINADFNFSGSNTNLIINGNFEGGNNDFTHGPGYFHNCVASSTAGQYCIGNNANSINGFWTGSPVSGNLFMFADGNPPQDVWCQTVAVSSNTSYNFEFWYNNVDHTTNPLTMPSDLQVTINTIPLFTTGLFEQDPDVWLSKSETWCSGIETSADICIQEINGNVSGLDFGIDSITFIQGHVSTATQEPNSCSCDPNDKLVTPQGCGPNGNISKHERLFYTIRFQNTGTGDAHNIILRDQLSSNLDLNTFHFVTSSHTLSNIQIIPDTTLILEFNGIELEPDSLGFVVFSIYPKNDLNDGATVTNQAGIYFDENDVVITNVTLNTLYDKPEPSIGFSHVHNCTSTQLSYDFSYTGDTDDNADFLWVFENATPDSSTDENPSNIVFSSTGYKKFSLTINRNGCEITAGDTLLVSSVIVNDSVRICHLGESSIMIPYGSLSTHLSHGDCVGNCDGSARLEKSDKENFKNTFNVKVVPNPASESCFIQLNNMRKSQDIISVELLSFTGMKIEDIYNGPANNSFMEFRLPVKNIENGLYFIKSTLGNNVKIVKILIQH